MYCDTAAPAMLNQMYPNLPNTPMYSLAPLNPISMGCVEPKKKKEAPSMPAYQNTTLAVSGPEPEEKRQRDYLVRELKHVWEEKLDPLPHEFGLTDDERPKSPKELVERIKAGQIVLPENADKENWYNPWDTIRWRNPKTKEDVEGYKAAKQELSDAFIKTKRQIMIASLADGLVALEKFEKDA